MRRQRCVHPYVLIVAVSLAFGATGAGAQPADDLRAGHGRHAPGPGRGRLADVAPYARRVGLQPPGPGDPGQRGRAADGLWSRGLTRGTQEVTPLAYGGVLYMPNLNDIIQAIDALTGDLIWSTAAICPRTSMNSWAAIHGASGTSPSTTGTSSTSATTTTPTHSTPLTGELAWETEIFDYQVTPAGHSSGPIIADGRVISGRSCRPLGGPASCVILAHDARTGAELWRRPTIPAPGEPRDETWGGVPYEQRVHVGSWMPASYDPELRLIYQGTSVTSPAPKFLLGGVDNKHLYHNTTLALEVETGEIRWYYQHLNDHWDLDHPFERLLVDTAVAPDPDAVSWINPRIQPGEVRKVVTGVPGKTGVGLHPRPGNGRVPLGDSHHLAERDQQHRRRHRRGDRERRRSPSPRWDRRCSPVPRGQVGRTGRRAPTAR